MAAPLEGLLERIAETRPMLMQNASKTEEYRQVVEENISALEDAGAFKIMVPKRYGGYEGTVKQKLQVSREIAMGCGSTAWVTALQNVCAYFTGKMSKQCQDDVWASTPDARIAGVFTPVMESRKVDGGIRMTGTWDWASGVMHADWLFLGAMLFDDAGAPMYPVMTLTPKSEFTVEDTWFMSGMKGTASNRVVAKDVFVPDHRIHSVPALLSQTYDTPFTDEVLYRSSFVPVAALVLAGPQLGLAQAALDYTIAKAPTRGITYSEWERQTDSPTFQIAIAKAAVLVDTAHLFAYRAADAIDGAALENRPMEYVERARVRSDTGVAISSAREAIRILCSAHGAGSFADASPMQRWWRDSEVSSRHAVIMPETSELIYGRALLGFTDGISFLV
jgi:3-hydroxy-9,10-secoandrosta-1,3,5(10)-triene-9,17-dione monooxygenase